MEKGENVFYFKWENGETRVSRAQRQFFAVLLPKNFSLLQVGLGNWNPEKIDTIPEFCARLFSMAKTPSFFFIIVVI